jgi:hypothetical protein
MENERDDNGQQQLEQEMDEFFNRNQGAENMNTKTNETKPVSVEVDEKNRTVFVRLSDERLKNLTGKISDEMNEKFGEVAHELGGNVYNLKSIGHALIETGNEKMGEMLLESLTGLMCAMHKVNPELADKSVEAAVFLEGQLNELEEEIKKLTGAAFDMAGLAMCKTEGGAQ